MIEYVLTTFSDQHAAEIPIRPDGSMHGFSKNLHVTNPGDLHSWADKKITTAIYPFEDQHLPDIIKMFAASIESWQTDHKILISAPDLRWAEINILFQYYKISLSNNRGLTIFQGRDESVVQCWDESYRTWQDLKHWQWREWFSIFYPNCVQEWIDSPQHVDSRWLCVSNQSLLENTAASLETIARYCKVSLTRDITDFCQEYQACQKYIIDEYNVIQSILRAVIDRYDFSWEPLSIVGEAILQRQFRAQGYEWYCDGLDVLPCHSSKLREIIYQEDLNA